MENSRNKQFLSYKLHNILGNTIEYCIVFFCATCGVKQNFAQCIQRVFVTLPPPYSKTATGWAIVVMVLIQLTFILIKVSLSTSALILPIQMYQNELQNVSLKLKGKQWWLER